MITQIEIDGFKTFKDFKVELAPFQVIVGPNGSGKSNLFDALHLLSRLADTDLRTAFQEVRGEARELFTKIPDGKSVERMKFAVEMLVNRRMQDDIGREFELEYTRLRYELEIVLHADEYVLDELYIIHELLKIIPRQTDSWCRKYIVSSQNDWLSKDVDMESPFFSFTHRYLEQNAILETHYLPLDKIEEDQIQIMDAVDSFKLKALKRTILSSSTVARSHHALAAREEIYSLQFLHLNPEALREPGSTNAALSLSSNGSNLPTMLARIQADDKYALTDISRDMSNLVRGIFKIRVEHDKASDKYVIYAETSDQQTFSAQVLSDGTLRLLALATLRNDPQFHGTLCLEEPENGVEPLHLKVMARVLREMATDFNDPEQAKEPLRQVLVTSHSPAFISLSEVFDSLLFTHLVTLGGSDQDSLPIRITRMEPVVTPNTQSRQQSDREGQQSTEIYTIDMVRQYLSSEDLNYARNQLKKARIHSIESNAS